MIRIASQPQLATPAWHEVFLKMAPAIKAHAQLSFRHLRGDALAEAIQNVLCTACAAVARLAELGKLDLCYPTVMARFAVAQTKDGRMLGRPLNCKDISSEYCRRKKGVVLERLDKYDREELVWQEILISDRTCTPAELAASRIDFPAWMKTLKPRDRRIAHFLALGNRTADAARKFCVSQGRVSQLRAELAVSWKSFVGDRLLPGDGGTPIA